MDRAVSEGFTSWADVRPPDLRAFLEAEAERRPSALSRARTTAALKGFFRFCVESEWLDRDPALVLRTPKKREALPDVLNRHELKRLMRAPDEMVWTREHRGRRERDAMRIRSSPRCRSTSFQPRPSSSERRSRRTRTGPASIPLPGS